MFYKITTWTFNTLVAIIIASCTYELWQEGLLRSTVQQLLALLSWN